MSIVNATTAYNTWRNETTEEQRNIRHASFRVLENLGELQQVVDFRIQGYGNVAMIHDLMMLMPAPAPSAAVLQVLQELE